MHKNKMIYTPIINTQCIGCGKCIRKCKYEILQMRNELGHFYAMVKHPDDCHGCEKCVQICPTEAICILTKEIITPKYKLNPLVKFLLLLKKISDYQFKNILLIKN